MNGYVRVLGQLEFMNRVYAGKKTVSIYGLAESVYLFLEIVYAQNLTIRSH